MGKPTEVSAKRRDCEHAVTIEYDFSDTLEEARELFGSDVVHSKFKQAAIIDLQSTLRRNMITEDKDGVIYPVSSEDIVHIEAVANWKPGLARVTKTPKEKAMEALKGISPEEIKQMLKELTDA